MCYVISIPEVGKSFNIFMEVKNLGRIEPPGVLNFHFGIGVRPEGPQMGLKERVGTKNRGLTDFF